MVDWGAPGDWLVLLKFIKSHWTHTLLVAALVVIVLLIHDPDRGERLRANFFAPLYRLFRLFPRQYLASRIGSSATVFIRKHVTKYIGSINKFRIRVKWVRSAQDPVLKRDGTILLHIPESQDQTLSILRATHAALPSLVCRSIRSNIDPNYCRAIDLTILKKLAGTIGPNAHPIFQKHFLVPETAEDLALQALLSELIEIDDHGIFVGIFLNELETFGIEFFSKASSQNLTTAVRGFLEFLLQFPRRQLNEEIRLTYNSPHFRVAVILVAKSERAAAEGVTPYVRRVHKTLTAGVDSIYLYAYQQSGSFLGKVCDVLRRDERIWVGEARSLRIIERGFNNRRRSAHMVQLTRNPLFCDVNFQEQIDALGITETTRMQGRVVSTSQSACLIEFGPFLGTLPRNLCSWRTVQSCEDVLAEEDVKDFLVQRIDREQGILTLSARLPEEDPWKLAEAPTVGDIIEATVKTTYGGEYICTTSDDVEVIIPRYEISWLPWECVPESVIGRTYECRIAERDEATHTLCGSVRGLIVDPWPELQRSLPPGTSMKATITSISDSSILVSVENGIQGFILGSAIDKAGLNFSEMQNSIAVGAIVSVQVDRVFRDRRKIRFVLAPDMPRSRGSSIKPNLTINS